MGRAGHPGQGTVDGLAPGRRRVDLGTVGAHLRSEPAGGNAQEPGPPGTGSAAAGFGSHPTRRPGRGGGLPAERQRPAAPERGQRRGLDGAGHPCGRPEPTHGSLLPPQGPPGSGVAGPGRGQRGLDRPARRALQALRRRQRLPAQDEPGQRLPGPGAGGDLRRVRGRRLCAHGLRGRRRGRLRRPAQGRRRDPHHRQRPHPRRHPLRDRRRGREPKARQPAPDHQADDQRAGQRHPHHRGPRALG